MLNFCKSYFCTITFHSTGTHDLDTITGPFIYDARPPTDISFVPLNQTQEIRADKMLEMFSHDSHLKEYVPIIKVRLFYQVERRSDYI